MHFPKSIIMEVSALCNVKCLGCALHGPRGFVTRPFGNMKKDVWETVIREAGAWNQKVAISAHGGGEPLMNPELRDILGLAKTFENIEVGFLTNGMLMDASWARFVVENRIDWVAFSVDGVRPETHDRIRKKSDLLTVEKHLETLLEIKKAADSKFPRVMLNMVAYDAIQDQKEAFIDKWIHRADTVMVSHYRNPPSSKRWPGVPDERKPCPLLWSQAVVAWDGRLGLCCEDFDVDQVSGRISPDTGLLSVWNGDEFNAVRELHRQGRYGEHAMCGVCDTWADSHRQTCTHEKGYQVVKTVSQTLYSLETL